MTSQIADYARGYARGTADAQSHLAYVIPEYMTTNPQWCAGYDAGYRDHASGPA